jgi:hypothetical protein
MVTSPSHCHPGPGLLEAGRQCWAEVEEKSISQDLINHRGEIWQLALEQGWLPRELDLPLIARVEGRPGFWDEDSASLMTVLRIQTDVN